MSENSLHIQRIEAALRQLSRLLKAVRYYPKRHPALAAAVEEVRQEFLPLLSAGNLLCLVRKEGFLLAEQPIAPANPILKKLALQLFARRVQSLLFLPDLSDRDLVAFAHCLTMEPAALQAMGGVPEVLAKAKVSTLWVNETSLAAILARKEELDAAKAELAGDTDSDEEDLDLLLDSAAEEKSGSGERDLESILNLLRQEQSDQQYRALLQEMAPLVRLALADTDRYLVLDALSFLFLDAANPRRSTLRRGLAQQALDQLASDEMLDQLIDFLCTRGVTETTRDQIIQILTLYPEKTGRRMMERLAVEPELASRRLLIEALGRQGKPAVPILCDYLADHRWFVVRNAVAILGEIRDPNVASQMTPLLQHRDLRVARETIRALTRIGGTRAVGILVTLTEGEDQDLARQAVLSLGAMKNPAAVPALLKIINRSDPWGKRGDLQKGAIKALGEIGAQEGIPPLLDLLRKKRLWRRAQHDELRAAAAAALGEIGAGSAADALEKAAEDRSEQVSRAAAQALKQIRKADVLSS